MTVELASLTLTIIKCLVNAIDKLSDTLEAIYDRIDKEDTPEFLQDEPLNMRIWK